MSATSPALAAGPRLSRAVRRRPVAATLIAMFTVSYALLIPPALAGLPLEPFLLAVVLFGQLLPAVLVTAAVGGRPAVRDLFGRVFRWRFSPGWWLVAFFAIPVASLLVATVLFGPGALQALATDRSVLMAYLSQLTILPLVNLWEETAWTGVVQARLIVDRGQVRAAVIVGLLFGLVHLPLQLGKPFGALLVDLSLLMVFSIGLRIVIGWLYAVTGGSIQVAAVTHATFNATNNNNLLTGAGPGNEVLTFIPWAVVAVFGIGLAVLRER
jgi:membrane protease YdiL (CAAX protease family)